ncbi:MAG: InlB B-repeat-containing protein [Defluviitaleaceae bacterium]|nr:InlB B-repeat-containing protein [Defluviitaleaceae bacterium]MCL2261879.1 InlB B-repeat-containing protein [Defluviitaleaceae bacterium]
MKGQHKRFLALMMAVLMTVSSFAVTPTVVLGEEVDVSEIEGTYFDTFELAETATVGIAPMNAALVTIVANGGAGARAFQQGVRTVVFAGNRPGGYVFNGWTGALPGQLANPAAAVTYFHTAPSSPITLTATWVRPVVTPWVRTFRAIENGDFVRGQWHDGHVNNSAGVPYMSTLPDRIVTTAQNFTLAAGRSGAQWGNGDGAGGGRMLYVTVTATGVVTIAGIRGDWGWAPSQNFDTGNGRLSHTDAFPGITFVSYGDSVPSGHTEGAAPFQALPSFAVTVNDAYGLENPNESGGGTAFPAGHTVGINAGVRDGYVFSRWIVEGDIVTLANVPMTTFTMPGVPVNITAEWVEAAAMAEVTFLLNDGILTGGNLTEFAMPGETVSLPTVRRPGHDFDGWFPVDENGDWIDGADEFDEHTEVNDDIRVMARWIFTNRFSLIVAESHAAANETGAGVFYAGERVVVSAGARTGGFFFTGWQGTDVDWGLATGGSQNAATTYFIMPENDVTLIATWQNFGVPSTTLRGIANTGAFPATGSFQNPSSVSHGEWRTGHGEIAGAISATPLPVDRVMPVGGENLTLILANNATEVQQNSGRLIHLTVSSAGEITIPWSGTHGWGVTLGRTDNGMLSVHPDYPGIVFVSYSTNLPGGHLPYSFTAFNTVTVEDSDAAVSGAGTFPVGRTVTIDAGARLGHSFSHWTVTPNTVTIHNPYNALTSFVMSAGPVPVTVTAHWNDFRVVPNVEWPQLDATFRQNLSNITLPTDHANPPGTFTWILPDDIDSAQAVSVGTVTPDNEPRLFPVTFTPATSHILQYQPINGYVSLTVNRANPADFGYLPFVLPTIGAEVMQGVLLSQVPLVGTSPFGVWDWEYSLGYLMPTDTTVNIVLRLNQHYANNYDWSIAFPADYNRVGRTIRHTLPVTVTPALTVNFDLNGGTWTGGGAISQGVIHGNNATPPETVRTGFDFIDWFTCAYPCDDVNCGNRLTAADFIGITAGFDARAKWYYTGLYTLTIMYGGDGVSGAGTVYTGDYRMVFAGTRPNNTFFAGWHGQPEDLALLVNPDAALTQITMPNRDVTLTATWEEFPVIPEFPMIVAAVRNTNNVPGFQSGRQSAGGNMAAVPASNHAFARWGTEAQGHSAVTGGDAFTALPTTADYLEPSLVAGIEVRFNSANVSAGTQPPVAGWAPNPPIPANTHARTLMLRNTATAFDGTGGVQVDSGRWVWVAVDSAGDVRITRTFTGGASWGGVNDMMMTGIGGASNASGFQLFGGGRVSHIPGLYGSEGERLTFISYGTALPTSDHVAGSAPVVPPLATFPVTVNGAFGDVAALPNLRGEGNFPAGAVVGINAGERTGYTFSHWTVTPDTVEIVNAGTQHQDLPGELNDHHENPGRVVTYFEMPAAPVTITAHWHPTLLEEPQVNWPTFNATFGQTLAEFTALLPSYAVTSGTFAWVLADGTVAESVTVGDVTTGDERRLHAVRFVPSDIATYRPITRNVSFIVARANPSLPPFNLLPLTLPTPQEILEGEPMEDFTLTGGSNIGIWAWQNPTDTPNRYATTANVVLTLYEHYARNFDWASLGADYDSVYGTITRSVTISVRAVHTVNFNLNGGTHMGGGELSQNVPHESAAVLPAVVFYGYSLVGWFSCAAGCDDMYCGAEISAADFANVTGNINAKAKWDYAGLYALTILEGGTGGTVSGHYTTDTRVILYAGTGAAGFFFAGWQGAPAGLLANPNAHITYFYMPASNVTLTATWTIADIRPTTLTAIPASGILDFFSSTQDAALAAGARWDTGHTHPTGGAVSAIPNMPVSHAIPAAGGQRTVIMSRNRWQGEASNTRIIQLNIAPSSEITVAWSGWGAANPSSGNARLWQDPTDRTVVFVSYGSGGVDSNLVPYAFPVPAPTFGVTVNGAFGEASIHPNLRGEGNFPEGRVVGLNAGERTGYFFSHWIVESGDATIAHAGQQHQQFGGEIIESHNSPGQAITWFTMPAEAVSVTAHWYRILEVPDVIFPQDVVAVFGQTLNEFTLSNTGATPGIFEWSAPTAVVGNATTGDERRVHTVTFRPTDNVTYRSMTGTVSFIVNRAVFANFQQATFPQLVEDDVLSEVALTGGSPVGQWVWVNPAYVVTRNTNTVLTRVLLDELHRDNFDWTAFDGYDAVEERITFTHNVTPTLRHSVTFNIGSATQTCDVDLLQRVIDTQAATVPEFTAPHGYTFGGWVSTPADMQPNNITADVTFTVQWNPVPWTVIFNLNGGVQAVGCIAPLEQTVYHNSFVQFFPEEPTRHGFTFVTWESSRDDIPAISSDITNNVTFTAQWEYDTWEVTFDLGGGVQGADCTVQLTQTITHTQGAAQPAVSRHGWVFAGWYSAAFPQMTPASITDNVTFVAQWQRGTWVVTFALGGGVRTGGGALIQTVEHEGEAEEPEFDYPHGYTFGGWASVPADMYLDDITDTVTFTAIWNPMPWTVTFNPSGGAWYSGGDLTQTIYHGSAVIDLPVVTRHGFNFAGWDVTPGVITDNTTFTAQWARHGWTVTFEENLGTRVGGGALTQYVLHESAAYEPIITRPFHHFMGWASSPAMETDEITNTVTFTPIWEIYEYDVVFNLAGGTYAGDQTLLVQVVEHGADAMPLTQFPSRAAFRFDGWRVNDGAVTSDLAPYLTNVTADMNIVAQWTALFTVTFNLNGGHVNYNEAPIVLHDIPDGSNLYALNLVPVPERYEMLFVAWITGEPGSYYNITSHRTLTATWRYADGLYVTVECASGGSFADPAAQRPNQPVQLRAGTRSAHHFVYWSVVSPAELVDTLVINNATCPQTAWFTMPTEEVVVRTNWELATVDFHLPNFATNDDHRNISEITLSDVLQSQLVFVSGSALGMVTFDQTSLPNGVEVVSLGNAASGYRLNVRGERPYTGDPITGTFRIYVTRQDVTEYFDVNVHLTAFEMPAVELTDNNLTQTVDIDGAAPNGFALEITSVLPLGYTQQITGNVLTIMRNAIPVFTATLDGSQINLVAIRPDTDVPPVVTGEFWMFVSRNGFYGGETWTSLPISLNLTTTWRPSFATVIHGGGTGASANPAPAFEGDTVYLNAGTPESGYRFTGWTTSPAALNITIYNPLSATEAYFEMQDFPVDVVANWVYVPTFTITVHGGTAVAYAQVGDTVYVTAGTPPFGQRFAYWVFTTSPAGLTLEGMVYTNAATSFEMPNGDVTLTANWEDIPPEQLPIVVEGAGAAYIIVAASAYPGDMVDLVAAPRYGFDFQYWTIRTTSPAGLHIGPPFNPTNPNTRFEMPNSPVYVSGNWTHIVHEITFLLAGGVYVGDNNLLWQVVRHGDDAYPLTSNPVRTGYTFTGWSVNGGAATMQPNLTNVTQALTLAAQWSQIQERTVTFDLAGGVYAGNQALLVQTVNHGANAIALTANPTREGYTFTGWQPAVNVINVTENRTFTAQWNEDTCCAENACCADCGFVFPGCMVLGCCRFESTVPPIGGGEMTVRVTVVNEFDNTFAFIGSTVTVEVENAPTNTIVQIETSVGFAIRRNPTGSVNFPVNVPVRTNADGAGSESVFISLDQILGRYEYETGYTPTGSDGSNGQISVPTLGDDILIGDVDGDDRVTSADATRLARWVTTPEHLRAAHPLLQNFCVLAADISGNGNPSPFDVILLARWLAGHNVSALMHGN